MLREYKICGNMIKYMNIYNAYHIHVLNKPFVSLFLGVEEAGSQCWRALHYRDYCISVCL